MPERLDLLLGNLGYVSQIGDVGVVMRQHCARERLDFSHRHAFPAKRVPGGGSGLNATE